MKKLLLPLLLCCSAIVYGQTSTFSFSRYIGTYTSIAGGPGTTATSMISSDDVVQTGINIGFTFSYCGTNYNTLSVNSNGWISLTNSPTTGTVSSYNNDIPGYPSSVPSIGSGVGLILPYWDDLGGTPGPHPPTSATATAYYQVSGASPNRCFTFQWGTPSSPWNSYIGWGSATFQVKLYETSGVIEFVYGTGTYSHGTATIGICNSTTDFRTLPAATSTAPTPSWNYLIDTSPVVNTVMEWAPPCPSPPPANTGTTVFCEGSATTLSNTATGGTWFSSSVSVATVGSLTGSVTGVAGGVANITYKVSPGCWAISTVTVNPLPDTIVGGAVACEGVTKTYSDVSSGGTWSSSNTAVGTISATGGFGGVTTGTTTVSYTFTSTGCARTLDVTVNSTPIITGSRIACLVDSTVLTSAVTGGTWASSNIARATVDAYGNVVGVSLGTVVITYTAPSGCKDTMLMTVQTDCPNAVRDVNGGKAVINIFPQPTNGDFSIPMPVTGSVNISISDMYGRTVISRKITGTKAEPIRFEESKNLLPGNYVIKLNAGDQMYVGKMMVIQ